MKTSVELTGEQVTEIEHLCTEWIHRQLRAQLPAGVVRETLDQCSADYQRLEGKLTQAILSFRQTHDLNALYSAAQGFVSRWVMVAKETPGDFDSESSAYLITQSLVSTMTFEFDAKEEAVR